MEEALSCFLTKGWMGIEGSTSFSKECYVTYERLIALLKSINGTSLIYTGFNLQQFFGPLYQE